jgi:hypothetical protein
LGEINLQLSSVLPEITLGNNYNPNNEMMKMRILRRNNIPRVSMIWRVSSCNTTH